MKILAVDTTAKTSAVAITENEKLIASTVLNTPTTHSVTLLPMIDALLKASMMTNDDIDIYACSAGPGSFTGVRIGVSLVKGLAFGSDKPCIGVSALEALARNMSMIDGIICPVMDARRSQLYNAIFTVRGGELVRLTEDRLIASSELCKELKVYTDNGEKVYFTGEGYAIAKRDIPLKNTFVAPEHCLWQNGYSVALSALDVYRKAKAEDAKLSGFTASKLSPIYLRASQAERERLEKLGNNASEN